MSKRKGYQEKFPQRGFSTISPAALRILAKPQYSPRTPRGNPPGFRRGFDRTAGYYGRYAPVNPSSAEMKFHDLVVNRSPVATAGNITDTVIVIPQGVGESQRVGRKCTIKSINWRFNFNLPEVDAASTPGAADVLRILVYLDKQCNGATALVADILQSADYQAFNNLSNKTRFRTLMDRTYAMSYAAMASDGAAVVSQAEVQMEDTFFKKCNIPIEYSSTTGAIAEIASNNIGILLISKNAICSLESNIRMRFHDY